MHNLARERCRTTLLTSVLHFYSFFFPSYFFRAMLTFVCYPLFIFRRPHQPVDKWRMYNINHNPPYTDNQSAYVKGAERCLIEKSGFLKHQVTEYKHLADLTAAVTWSCNISPTHVWLWATKLYSAIWKQVQIKAAQRHSQKKLATNSSSINHSIRLSAGSTWHWLGLEKLRTLSILGSVNIRDRGKHRALGGVAFQ